MSKVLLVLCLFCISINMLPPTEHSPIVFIEGTAVTAYSGMRKIICAKVNDSVFILRDLTKRNGIITLNSGDNARIDFVSKSSNWILNGQDQYALDVHYGVSQTYIFFKDKMGRDGFTNENQVIYNYVNDPATTNNAIWDGGALRFGVHTESGATVASLDILAHELTHIIIANTCRLSLSGESGAINESICDIFGLSVEHWTNFGDSSWTIGGKMNYKVRDMSRPTLYGQPDTYKDFQYWYTGKSRDKTIHRNSGIGNKMFYLLVHGGEGKNAHGTKYNVKGIGLLQADSIIFRTVTHYLEQGSQYCDWKTACIKSAIDLYGKNSKQVKSVENAWVAVGVPFCNDNLTKFPLTPNTTLYAKPDSMRDVIHGATSYLFPKLFPN